MEIRPIALIRNDFKEKFGVPRQSGLAGTLSRIVFEPEFRDPLMLRGLEDYSHLWLIWSFSENLSAGWTPTVRPPKLGGNTRVGVFATRSSFRPNGLALSSVELAGIERTEKDGTVLLVRGADLMNGTPIFDIKPYLPYTDAHPEAKGSFGEAASKKRLEVCLPDELRAAHGLSEDEVSALCELLALDPRPGYQNDPERVYGLCYGDLDVHFRVEGSRLTVTEITAADRLR